MSVAVVYNVVTSPTTKGGEISPCVGLNLLRIILKIKTPFNPKKAQKSKLWVPHHSINLVRLHVFIPPEAAVCLQHDRFNVALASNHLVQP